MVSSKKKGDRGELLAIKYLQSKGHLIIDTNFTYSVFGEIDIISSHGDMICFFEVKYRENCKFGYPEESLTKNKKQKIKKAIEYYIMLNEIDADKIRFDFISILKEKSNFKIKHYKNLEL